MRAKLAALSAVLSLLGSCDAIAGVSYTYDGLGRLTKAAYDNGKEIDYAYDQAGNRSSVMTQSTPHMGAVKSTAKVRSKHHKHVATKH